MAKPKINLAVEEDLWHQFKKVTPHAVKLNDRICELIQQEVNQKMPAQKAGLATQSKNLEAATPS